MSDSSQECGDQVHWIRDYGKSITGQLRWITVTLLDAPNRGLRSRRCGFTSSARRRTTRFAYDGLDQIAEYNGCNNLLQRATSSGRAPISPWSGTKAPAPPTAASSPATSAAASSASPTVPAPARDRQLRRIWHPRHRQRRPVPIHRPGLAARARHVILQGPHLLADARAVPADRSDRDGRDQPLRLCRRRSGQSD